MTGEIRQSSNRTGADGRTINISNIGKSRADTQPMYRAFIVFKLFMLFTLFTKE